MRWANYLVGLFFLALGVYWGFGGGSPEGFSLDISRVLDIENMDGIRMMGLFFIPVGLIFIHEGYQQGQLAKGVGWVNSPCVYCGTMSLVGTKNCPNCGRIPHKIPHTDKEWERVRQIRKRYGL